MEVPKEIQDFVNARGLPAVFLCPMEPLTLAQVLQLRTAIGNQKFQELDLVIESEGGDVHSAYLIIDLLRLHCEKLNACVPLYAKSAATLLCVGADVIVLDEIAQLGPLDTQIMNEKEGGKREWNSALNPFKTLEQLEKFATNTFDHAVALITERSGLTVGESVQHAIRFVEATTGPLFRQVDPRDLGNCSRALSIGTEYGYRLLGRQGKQTEEEIKRVIDKLVQGYPSHDYVIDYCELRELGFDVRFFTEKEQVALQGLASLLSKREPIVNCFKTTLNQEQTSNLPNAEGPQGASQAPPHKRAGKTSGARLMRQP
jgi:hypothetical protein